MSQKKFPYRWWRIAVSALVLAAAVAAFAFGCEPCAKLMHLQFAPAVMRFASGVSRGAAVAAAAIAIVTLLFGRFYCACFCPFGILQDLVGWLSRRKCTLLPDLAKTRYFIAAFAWGMLAAGWTLPLLLLDPYSNYGRIFASGLTVGGLLPLVAIAALSIWKKRLFCVAVCPVGTVLGLLSRNTIVRLKFPSSCVKCGACVRNCPAGCIDLAAKKVDNERCVRCLNCISVCKFHGIGFTEPPFRRNRNEDLFNLMFFGEKPPKPPPPEPPFDGGRRSALVELGIILAGAAAGAALAKGRAVVRTTAALDLLERKVVGILPPGALDPKRFADRCTACQLCAANCPRKIIVPTHRGDGPVVLDLSKGACDYGCSRCSQLCPTGALVPLALERKRRLKIAEAKFDPKKCLVFQEEAKCGKCAAVCPTGAITLRKSGAPRLKPQLCIGCGECAAACPVPGKAMSVRVIEKQEFLNANG